MKKLASGFQQARNFSFGLCVVWLGFAQAYAQTDALPSWNDTASKRSIVAFVEQVTKVGYFNLRPATRANCNLR